MEEIIRKYGEEEAVRLINIIIENGKKKYWKCRKY